MKSRSIALLGLAAASVATIAIVASRKSNTPSASDPLITRDGLGVPVRTLPSGAYVFGAASDSEIPSSFDTAGNGVLFLNDCTSVVVGAQLWTSASGSRCSQMLNGQNLCVAIDSLMQTRGLSSARDILAAIVAGLEPPCLNDETHTWPPAMKSFVNWLAPLVNDYVIETGGSNPNPEAVFTS